MISYAVALQHILQACQPLPSEPVPLTQALGRVLAQDVQAGEDLPPFDNSAMDGFAVACGGVVLAPGQEFSVAGSHAAGDGLVTYARDACEIMTGASLPEGLDSVVPVEQISVLQRNEEGRPLQIRLGAEVAPGAHVRRRGEDVCIGDQVAFAGTQLTPASHMLLAALGVATLAVRPQVPVALFPTGRELVDDPAQPLLPGQIRNSNGPYLAERLNEAGACVVHRETVGDDAAAFTVALKRGLAAGAQVVLSTGAVSMGRHDFVPDALRELGARIVFHKVAIRPGKPLLFARLPGGQLYFGLPGNPVSSVVGMRFFVEPALRAMLGLPQERPLLLPLVAEARKKTGLKYFMKARVALDDGANLTVEVMTGQESFRIKPLLAANAWAVLDAEADILPAGTLVPVFGLDGRGIVVTSGEDAVGH